MAYKEALVIQEETVACRKTDGCDDTLLLVEHDPVFTLGRNATRSNIVATAGELAARGVQVVETGRGGQVTYHGPGQLVGYPILKLDTAARGPVWYVARLEEVLLRTVAAFGLTGGTDPANRGVWIGDEKIAAIGVRITQHVTMHGFSLNVHVQPEDYRGIIPCGIAGKGVTSLHLQGVKADMAGVKQEVTRCFCEVFGYDGFGDTTR
jgi:lipoyl(octanoyl) transferase